METINKLLKKQAPKTNARRRDLNGESTPDSEAAKPNALFVRWISTKEGNRIGVPEEWLDAPAGGIFKGGVKQAPTAVGESRMEGVEKGAMGGRLIEEVA
jgi:Ino eighty subunit 2